MFKRFRLSSSMLASGIVILKIYLFIYLLAVLDLRCCMGFSLVAASGGYSSCGAPTSPCSGLSCLWAWAQGCPGLRSRGPRSLGHRLCLLWYMDLLALQHMASSQIRNWTHVSCTGQWILYHWATREAHYCHFSNVMVLKDV